MATTRNKIKISETLYLSEKINVFAPKQSEYIIIKQDDDCIFIRTDEITFLISLLEQFYENGEITEN